MVRYPQIGDPDVIKNINLQNRIMNDSNSILESPKTSSKSQATNQIGACNELGEIKKIKLPPFWQTKPFLWFTEMDAQFFANNIRSHNVKYYTVVAALDSQALEQVSDVVESLPESEKYQILRKQLIARFTDSEVKQLRKLLSKVELGDKKPSQLLRKMKILAKEKVSQNVLRTLWIQRLPIRVQVVLSVNEDAELGKHAEMGDNFPRIHSYHFTYGHPFALVHSHTPFAAVLCPFTLNT